MCVWGGVGGGVGGVCVWGVCMYVHPAMRFVMLRDMGLKLSMGIGDGLPRLKGAHH